MAMQMYFVAFQGNFNQQTSREVQQLIYERHGFTLMVTKTGLIAALDDAEAPVIGKHNSVRSIGGVTLNPRGFAAQHLQRIFAQNLSRQVDLSKLT
jgi:hypothetical protein